MGVPMIGYERENMPRIEGGDDYTPLKGTNGKRGDGDDQTDQG